MMKFLPWKKNNDNAEPELDALMDSGPALGDSTFDDDADRSSEEEDLLNQYLNSDNDSEDDYIPSAGSFPDSSEDSLVASENREMPTSVPSGGSEDDPDDDESGSVGFDLPLDSDESEDDNDEGGSVDPADEVMSIFDDEEEVDEDLSTLTQGLLDIDAAELLAEARSVARKLASMTSR